MRKWFIYLAIGLAVVLFFMFYHTDKRNGFNRTIITKAYTIDKVINLPTSKFYYVGAFESIIYLKNLYNLKNLYFFDTNLNILGKIDLKLKIDSTDYNPRLNIAVQDTSIFIVNNNPSTLIVTGLESRRRSVTDLPPAVYDQPAFLSPGSIITRVTINKNGEMQRNLTKVEFGKRINTRIFTFDRQVDGYFCNDGMSKYDHNTSRLFYMYFYRGELLCLDTNLNLIYRLKTIDTVKHANIHLAKLRKVVLKDTITAVTQASPPKYVNKRFFTDKDNIYVLSAIRADNEKQSDFKKSQIVDVYNILKGKYSYSFYIPNYMEKKLRQIMILHNSFYVIYGDKLVKMTLKK